MDGKSNSGKLTNSCEKDSIPRNVCSYRRFDVKLHT